MSELALVVQHGEVLDQPTLVDLRQTIAWEHGAVERNVASALCHAIKAGEALLLAKSLVPRGKFLEWRTANCPFSRHSGTVYMRLAEAQHMLPAETTSIASALHLLRSQGFSRISGDHRRLDPDIEGQVKDLFSEGLTRAAVAQELGISSSSVGRILDPRQRARSRLTSDRAHRRRAAEAAALRKQEREQIIRRAVRKAGAALSETYSRVESLDAVIAQAHREATDTEAREALSLATSHYHKMRDEIVRALGVS